MVKTNICFSGNQFERNNTQPSIKVEVAPGPSHVVDSNNAVVENTNSMVNDRASSRVLIVSLEGYDTMNEQCIQTLESEGFSRCNLVEATVSFLFKE